jgi:hypothetical protein
MATQTVRHCAGCHGFTAEVPVLATRDSARGTLVPGRQQCLGCHEMQRVLADFDEGKDPHGGKCGACHNPHTQKSPQAAAASCATSGCHANWRDEPFHVGASHRGVGAQCLTCHLPHSSKVDASDCQGCHESVRARSALRPPVRFDTTRALRRVDTLTRRHSPETQPALYRHSSGYGSTMSTEFVAVRDRRHGPSAEPEDSATAFQGHDALPTMDGSALPAARQDTFPHARHATLACLVCHETGSGHGRLTFEPPRGCAICHHSELRQTPCAACHQTAEYSGAKPMSVSITVPGRQPNPRPVDFLHSRHAARPCGECHTTPVTLAPGPTKAQCKDCHSEHHAADRACSSCHTLAVPGAEHKTLETAHQRCDACHTAATVALLTPTRSLCSTCHVAKATNHYDARECSTCHFLAAPPVYRSKLITPPPG